MILSLFLDTSLVFIVPFASLHLNTDLLWSLLWAYLFTDTLTFIFWIIPIAWECLATVDGR